MKRYLFVMLLFLVACDLTNGPAVTPEEIDLHTGTRGIEASFLNPIDEVREGTVLESSFVLENHGPHDTTVHIVAAVNKAYLQFTDKNGIKRFSQFVPGKTPVAPHARSASIPFALRANVLGGEEDKEVDFDAVMCYDYRGMASLEVCVDQDPSNLEQYEKSCEVRESNSIGGGQGGPVAITKIEHTTIIDEQQNIKPQFRIYVDNRGSGEVRRYGKAAMACSGQVLAVEDYNVVEIESIQLGNRFVTSDFSCDPSIILSDDEDYFTCTLLPGKLNKVAGTSYMTDLTVNIKYGYKEDLSEKIYIKKS